MSRTLRWLTPLTLLAVAGALAACGEPADAEPDTLLDATPDVIADTDGDDDVATVPDTALDAEDTSSDDTVDASDTAELDTDAAGDTAMPDDTEEPPFDCYAACLEIGDVMGECLGDILAAGDTASRLLPAGWTPAGSSLALRIAPGVELDDALARITGAATPGALVTVSRTQRLVVVDEALPIPTARRETLRESAGVTGELVAARLPGGHRVVVLPRLALQLDAGVDGDDLTDTLLARHDLHEVDRLELAGDTHLIVELGDPGADVFLTVAQLRLEPGLARVTPDLLRSAAPQNDPLLEEQWHLTAANHPIALPSSDIQVLEAWDVHTGSADTVIAVFDDGVDRRHPDLTDAIVPGIAVPDDLAGAVGDGCCLHGTAVAGVAAARGFNGLGGRGVCPSCSIMPIHVEFGALSDVEVAGKLAGAVDMGAAVINNSWGYVGGDPAVDELDAPTPPPLSPLVADALRHAEIDGRDGKGTIVVWAAGNYNGNVSNDPYNAVPTVISVAAHDDQNRKSWYSDWGSQVLVSAPSSGGLTPGIVTTVPESLANQYGEYFEGSLGERYTKRFGGTSSATPTVSGLVGLMVSLNPELTAGDVRRILRETADPIDRVNAHYDSETGHSLVYGHGSINAYRAMLASLPDDDTTCALRTEVCNGVDDNCDGIVDPDCEQAGWCASCAYDAACASGVCARTPGDLDERCLTTCTNRRDCPPGAQCQGGVCIPARGRCGRCASQDRCNGVDDDCDGQIDESGCSPATNGRCHYDGECADGSVCAVGRCRRTCESESDCGEGALCLEMTGRYGETDGRRLCAVSEGVRICDEYICQTGYSDKAKRKLFECFDDFDYACGAMLGCWLQFP